jgi:hypothetical protein
MCGATEDVMRKNAYLDPEHTRDNGELTLATAAATGALPNRLLTAFEVAEFVGCHEETDWAAPVPEAQYTQGMSRHVPFA